MAQKGVYGRQCLATGERGANPAPFTEAAMAGYGGLQSVADDVTYG